MERTMKEVDKKKNPGLAKLPKGVRNKMGYKKKGGMIKSKGMKMGGKVKPKGMKMGGKVKPKGMKSGGVIQGTPASQVKGTKFKGVF